MARIFIKKDAPRRRGAVPLIHVTIEAPGYGGARQAALSFETKRGFGFQIPRADARRLVRKLAAALEAPAAARGAR